MGRIHSLQTMGLVDGPGIRSVVFFQGCSLRCAYCHNPDTWEPAKGQEITAADLVQKLVRYQPYFEKSGGGVTCSGGEPLLQPDFLVELLSHCKAKGIHTALDTSGVGLGDYAEILSHTDLAILDIKHTNPAGFKALTGGEITRLEEFIKSLNKSVARVWVRHVVVPGITDGDDHLHKLQTIISTIKNVDKVELLPYHQLGVHKYQALGFHYKLQNIQPFSEEQFKQLEAEFFATSACQATIL